MASARRTRASSIRGDWYDHPSWYDILHAPGTAGETSILERLAMRHVRTRARREGPVRVLEPACGTGRYLRVLAGRSYDVMGFDSKSGMIGYAKQRMNRAGRRADLFVGDMTQFSLRSRADFAFCTFSTIRHITDDQSVLAHLACTARSLRAGGVYIVGLDIADPEFDRQVEDRWVGVRGRCRVTQRVRYTPPARSSRRERVDSEMCITTPLRVRTLETTYHLRTYTSAQWRSLVRRSPFSIVGAYDVTGAPIERDAGPGSAGGYRMFVLGR